MRKYILLGLILCCGGSCHADIYDDMGWAGDVGLVTGLTFELTNGPKARRHPDPFYAELTLLISDYGGQRALRGEPLFPDQAHPIGGAEMEEMLTAFAINQGILLPIECLLHMR